jgi:hypothetical protein
VFFSSSGVPHGAVHASQPARPLKGRFAKYARPLGSMNETLSAEEAFNGGGLKIRRRLETRPLDQPSEGTAVTDIEECVECTAVGEHVQDHAKHTHEVAGIVRVDADQRAVVPQRRIARAGARGPQSDRPGTSLATHPLITCSTQRSAAERGVAVSV